MDDINSNISNHNNNNNNNNNKEQILLRSKKTKPDTVQSEQRQMMATTATNAITTTTMTMTSNHNNLHSRQQQQQQQQQPQPQHSDYIAAKSKYPNYQQQSTRVYKSNMQQWTNEEHIILIQGCYMYGDKDGRISWKDIIPMLQQQANKKRATDTDATTNTTITTNSSNNYKTKTYTDRCIKNRWHNKIKKLILKYRYNNNDNDYDSNNSIKTPIKNPTRLDMALYLKQVLHTNIDDPAYHTTTPAAATASRHSSTSVPFLRYGHTIDATTNTNFRTTLGTSNGNITTTNVVAKAIVAKAKQRNLLEKKQKYRRSKNKNKNSKWTKEEDEHIIQRVKEMQQKSEESISWVQIVQSLNKPGIITNTHVKNRWNSRLKDLQLTKNDNNNDDYNDMNEAMDDDDEDDMNEALDEAIDDDDDDDDNDSETMDDDGDDDEDVKQGAYIPYANPYDNNSDVDDDNHSSNKSSSSNDDNDNNRNKNGNNSSRSPTKAAKLKPKSKRWTFEEDKCILESIIHLQGLKQKWKMVAKHPMFSNSNSQRTNTEIRNRWNNTLKQDIIDRIYYTRTINIARTPQTMHNIPTDPTNDDIQQFIYDMNKTKQQRPPPPLTIASSSNNADGLGGGLLSSKLIRRRYKCDRTVIETFVKLLGGTIQWEDDDDDDDDKKKYKNSNSNRKNIDGEDADARTFTAKQPPQVQREPQQRQQQYISSGMISSHDEIMATVKNENNSNTKDGSDDVDGGVESDGDDLVF